MYHEVRAHTQDARNRGSVQRLDPRTRPGKKRNQLQGSLSEMHSSLIASTDSKRIIDGTNPKELLKAMSTYLNETGAGDYNLPVLLGEKIADSNKKTNPNWSFQSRNKLGWYRSNVPYYLSS